MIINEVMMVVISLSEGQNSDGALGVNGVGPWRERE
jgi:hypothetical protein